MIGTSKDIKYPGLNILPPGVERHVVNGGALTAFQIFPDDELEIINNEGNQICEIICFNKDGKSDLGILNLKSNNEKNYIRNILSGNDETILATNYQLKKRNLKISNSKSSIIFDGLFFHFGPPKSPRTEISSSFKELKKLSQLLSTEFGS